MKTANTWLLMLAAVSLGACSTLSSLTGGSFSHSKAPASAANDTLEPDEDSPRPAAAGHGWPSWRRSESKITEDCTFKGTVSALCVKLYIKDEDGRASKGPTATATEKEALRCMLVAGQALKYPGGDIDKSSAGQLIEQAEDDSPHGKECIRVTDLAVGNSTWKKGSLRLKEQALWAKRMSEVVNATFRKKCGVDATLDGPTFASLSMERVTSNTRVFYDGNDGGSGRVTVYCGGKIIARSAGGGSMTMVAKTWGTQAKEHDEEMCLLACAHKNGTCLMHNSNLQEPACRAACEPSCR